jgi:hypothetical protein
MTAQPRSVSGTTPTRSPIRLTARFIDSDGSSAIASDTSRNDLSRSSWEYFLGAGKPHLPGGIRPCTKPGAIQTAANTPRATALIPRVGHVHFLGPGPNPVPALCEEPEPPVIKRA